MPYAHSKVMNNAWSAPCALPRVLPRETLHVRRLLYYVGGSTVIGSFFVEFPCPTYGSKDKHIQIWLKKSIKVPTE